MASGSIRIMPRPRVWKNLGEAVLGKGTAAAHALMRDRTSRRIAAVVLVANLAFIVAHCARYVATLLGASDGFFLIEHFELFRVDRDGSLAEWFLYLQASASVALLLGIYFKTRQSIYAAWSLVFAFIVADDALLIHERLGHLLVNSVAVPALPGLRAVDSGELLIWAAAGIVLLAGLAWGFARSNDSARAASGLIAVAFAALVFFAMGIDMLHVGLVDAGTPAYLIFALVEDGGEMLAIGLALAVALVLYRHPVVASEPRGLQVSPSPL